MKKIIFLSIVVIIVLTVAYWLVSPLWNSAVLDEQMPRGESSIVGRADMIARAHEVKGVALLVKSDNKTLLRFENLKTINGPDLRIYLSASLNADDVIDLGPIRATEGNMNYVIPSGTDLKKYRNVMIWCRAFGVLFSYASFSDL